MEKKGRKVTRKDVAALAGVSETIVSYVLNENRYVKEEKRQRVLEAVEQLKYQPNNIARALHGKGSRQILFVAEELNSGYFPKMVSQMSRDAYEQGYMISLCESQEEEEFVSRIISRQFDGLFISAAGITDRQLMLLAKTDIPMVVFANRQLNCELPQAVLIDTGLYDGSRECVRYLAASGCRKLIYLDREGTENVNDMHFMGFMDQIKEEGLEFTTQQKISGYKDMEEMKENLRELLGHDSDVDAIVARYDDIAAAAMQAAAAVGRKIPEELSVVGFDNDFISEYLTPSLTTVEIQKEEVGKAAMKALLEQIRGEKPKIKLKFQTKLIFRNSTRII